MWEAWERWEGRGRGGWRRESERKLSAGKIRRESVYLGEIMREEKRLYVFMTNSSSQLARFPSRRAGKFWHLRRTYVSVRQTDVNVNVAK